MPSAFANLSKNAQWYLAKVKSADPAQAFTWQMLAARSYLANGQTKPALALFQQLQKQANGATQKAQLQLLQAHVLLAQGNANQALILLEGKPETPLDADTQKDWYRQRVVLQLNVNNKFGAAKSLIAMEPYLNQSEQTTNHQQIWSLLQGMPSSTLRALEVAKAPDVTTGWLRLAALVSEFRTQPKELAAQLASWKREFPNHPALREMQAGLGKFTATTHTTVQHIAVLLPLSGKLERQGSAIRNGMLMSYKENQGKFALNFYDTQKTAIGDLYKQAIEKGADMIIGPLIKARVEELLKLHPTVPVLALNELNKPVINDATYYFSLSAAADAAQAAQYLFDQGYRKPLVIAARGRVGNTSIKGFEQHWATLSKDQPIVATFSARNEVPAMVKKALSGRVANKVGEVVSIADAAPHNIDAVYVVANSLETRMIKPYVDISVNPMGSLPIYASSRSYDGAATEVASELNGMRIADMPLLLGGYETQRAQISQLWPTTQGDLLRFFAMGYDAISVVKDLPQMRTVSGMQQAGMTGKLSVDPQGNIIRMLSWATYQNGKLVDENAVQPLEVPSNERAVATDAPAVAAPTPTTHEQGSAL
ncbi:MAG: penicillin-binding protein activator [Aeromonas sp.]